MPYVHEAGKFYLIDPYTGKVFGPYGTFEQMADVAWQLFGSQCSNVQRYSPLSHDIKNQGVSGGGTNGGGAYAFEALPWWHDLKMRDRFCGALSRCCGTPMIAPAGCPNQPLGLPAVTDPCKMVNYVPPGTGDTQTLCTKPGQVVPNTGLTGP
jgi:hypothetical protein